MLFSKCLGDKYIFPKKKTCWTHFTLTFYFWFWNKPSQFREIFDQLLQKDLQDLDIEMSENDIMNYKKCQWKLFVKDQVKNAAFMFLVNGNSLRKKTKDIIFSELKMSDYLFQNRKEKLSGIFFSVRVKSFI